ncbi:unnamed protein product [Schistosoma margrebowiei]|uniref:Uncharacterized protein n=1 Tax=Schistosoma margrebowiei TaxID=48269 RepID=A0A183LC36_9TREM|nr:unnamed protein product [Schistosoma margrebowiei]
MVVGGSQRQLDVPIFDCVDPTYMLESRGNIITGARSRAYKSVSLCLWNSASGYQHHTSALSGQNGKGNNP